MPMQKRNIVYSADVHYLLNELSRQNEISYIQEFAFSS